MSESEYNTMSSNIESIEKEIDTEFSQNQLIELNYAQSIWTLLSVLEDDFLRNIINGSSNNAYSDTMLNAISHPIRFLYKTKTDKVTARVNQNYVDQHFGWGLDWIDKSKIYDKFYSIFSLWHKNKLQIFIEGNHLNTDDWKNRKFKYEAYNRIIQEPNRKKIPNIDIDNMLGLLMANVSVTETKFKLNLNPKLAKTIIENYTQIVDHIYDLPYFWSTSKFTYGEFKKVFISIQALLYSMLIVRINLAKAGMRGFDYSSAVWVVSHDELLSRIVRYSNIPADKTKTIFEFLKYGSNDIRNPDVAIQPLIDLENGFYALSPFVWLNSNAERNFCVLLNMIEVEKNIYSKLKNEKEVIFRDEVISNVRNFGYETINGRLDKTDLDIAIIDRSEKICVCIELKWFISPAEIREIDVRTEELAKGIEQTNKIIELYKKNDSRLTNLLKIDNFYRVYFFVGSKNWIGSDDVQDIDIPIINMKLFLDKLAELRNLKLAADWFNNREYLPVEGTDYEIVPISLKLGKWHSSWYGIYLKGNK